MFVGLCRFVLCVLVWWVPMAGAGVFSKLVYVVVPMVALSLA